MSPLKQVCKNDYFKFLYVLQLWELQEEFERMTEDLQEQAQFQPLVNRPYVGMLLKRSMRQMLVQ